MSLPPPPRPPVLGRSSGLARGVGRRLREAGWVLRPTGSPQRSHLQLFRLGRTRQDALVGLADIRCLADRLVAVHIDLPSPDIGEDVDDRSDTSDGLG